MGSFSSPCGQSPIHRIAIIGAGPTGLAAAKYLQAEGVFSIDIYEQQAEVGGVWNYTPNKAEKVAIPQTSPEISLDKPFLPMDAGAPIFSNPMYECLHTNIPKNLMQYSDQAFPSTCLLYPTRQDVQEYLVSYSKEIRDLLLFSTQVEDITHSRENGQDQWKLVAKSTITNQESHKVYDGIVVANGHYSVPFIPSVPGICKFSSAYPGVVSHSKLYRSPSDFAGKKVIVVGNGPSGLDIGTQIEEVCDKPLLNSIRKPSTLKLGREKIEEVPEIAEYLVQDRAVRFEDGRIESGIDAVVYCTGYLYSYPFLKSLNPRITTSGRRAVGLWQQLFNISYPSLAFPVVSQKIIPFPLSEVQGAAIAKVWSGKLELPGQDEMWAWEQSRVVQRGDGTAFHVLGYPEDADYINYLHDWTMTAEKGSGKEPPFWGARQRWVREIYAEIRKKWIDTGSIATSLKELGIEFDKQED